MQTDTPTKEFDPNNDPAKLARIGAHVTKRLDANPLVQQDISAVIFADTHQYNKP